MLLTVSLFSKGSFLGSLINKCRPDAVAKISLSSPTTYISKTLEEKLGMPPKPKRPLTPYFRFMNEQRPKLQASYPQLPITEIVKKVSKEWETADSALKQRLQEDYKMDQQKYVENRTKYDLNITDEQRLQLKELKQERSEAKEKRMMRKRVKFLGRPKKPASAFLKFIAKERSSSPRPSTETFREWLQKTTIKWSTLTDEQKSIYLVESRKEWEIYKKEISLWEERMIRMGNNDVVRHSNLIDPPEPKPRKH